MISVHLSVSESTLMIILFFGFAESKLFFFIMVNVTRENVAFLLTGCPAFFILTLFRISSTAFIFVFFFIKALQWGESKVFVGGGGGGGDFLACQRNRLREFLVEIARHD